MSRTDESKVGKGKHASEAYRLVRNWPGIITLQDTHRAKCLTTSHVGSMSGTVTEAKPWNKDLGKISSNTLHEAINSFGRETCKCSTCHKTIPVMQFSWSVNMKYQSEA